MTNLIHKLNLKPKLLLIFLMMIRNQVDHFWKVLNLTGINPNIKGINCILFFSFLHLYTLSHTILQITNNKWPPLNYEKETIMYHLKGL